MHRLLSRTSITEDEAVSILLGRTTGPIEFKPRRDDGKADANGPIESECMDDDDEANANCPVFCLRETLDDELELLDGEYRLAKREKQSTDVVAERLAALQRHEEIIEQANVHLCAIRDELNKGEQSVLKVDSALSNAAYTYITLHSFNEWVKCREGAAGGQSGAVVPAGSRPAGPGDAAKPAPRTKLRDQEDAILAEIVKQKSDPTSLPRNEPGKPGVKADVRKALRGSPLFAGKTTFDRAWERLRKDRRIVEKA